MHFPVPRTTQIIVARLKARAEKPHLCGQTCCGKLPLPALKKCMYDFGQHSGSSLCYSLTKQVGLPANHGLELDPSRSLTQASVPLELSHGGDVANAFGSLSRCESCCLSSRYQPAHSLCLPLFRSQGERV